MATPFCRHLEPDRRWLHSLGKLGKFVVKHNAIIIVLIWAHDVIVYIVLLHVQLHMQAQGQGHMGGK